MYENLLAEANKFLHEHPEYNEIELSDGNLKVRVVRWTPAPMTAPFYPPTYWPQPAP